MSEQNRDTVIADWARDKDFVSRLHILRVEAQTRKWRAGRDCHNVQIVFLAATRPFYFEVGHKYLGSPKRFINGAHFCAEGLIWKSLFEHKASGEGTRSIP